LLNSRTYCEEAYQNYPELVKGRTKHLRASSPQYHVGGVFTSIGEIVKQFVAPCQNMLTSYLWVTLYLYECKYYNPYKCVRLVLYCLLYLSSLIWMKHISNWIFKISGVKLPAAACASWCKHIWVLSGTYVVPSDEARVAGNNPWVLNYDYQEPKGEFPYKPNT